MGLGSEAIRFDTARDIHKRLSEALGKKEFFGDKNEFEADFDMLDMLCYAYIREELVNTPESKEVEYLKQQFPELIRHCERVHNLKPG